MRKCFLLNQICSLLLLIFILPCYGQTDGYFFRCGIRDKTGNLWFSNMGNGVYRYDPITGKCTNFTKEDGLNDNNIESIYEDKAGNLWFSTEKGVCRYDPSAPLIAGDKLFSDITTKIGLCQFYVNCVSEDRNGNYWFGTNGYGVCRYNPTTGAVTNFTKEHGLGSNAVQCILEDKAGNLWFGERAGGVCRFDAASGKFIKVNDGGCFSSQIMSIIEDKNGNIWFVNLYSGLCRYDPSANFDSAQHKSLSASGNSYKHFTREDGLCSDSICCMYEDKKGNLWFGSDSKWNTGAGGLCRYDPYFDSAQHKSGTGQAGFTHFSTKDGLENSDVFTIVVDNDGNIWVGTRGGLFRYHSPSGKFINYTHKVKSNN